jgi:hypothetical protein
MVRMLGAAIRPDPEGWEHDIQLPPYKEFEFPKPENKNGDMRSSDSKEYPFLL